MKHPNPANQKQQDVFLKVCPDDQREEQARLFRLMNATYIYHQLPTSPNKKSLESYYQEWLEGLPANIREDMKKKGFEECLSMLPFTQYVNERKEIGKDAWMKEKLSEEDYNYLLSLGKEV